MDKQFGQSLWSPSESDREYSTPTFSAAPCKMMVSFLPMLGSKHLLNFTAFWDHPCFLYNFYIAFYNKNYGSQTKVSKSE